MVAKTPSLGNVRKAEKGGERRRKAAEMTMTKPVDSGSTRFPIGSWSFSAAHGESARTPATGFVTSWPMRSAWARPSKPG